MMLDCFTSGWMDMRLTVSSVGYHKLISLICKPRCSDYGPWERLKCNGCQILLKSLQPQDSCSLWIISRQYLLLMTIISRQLRRTRCLHSRTRCATGSMEETYTIEVFIMLKSSWHRSRIKSTLIQMDPGLVENRFLLQHRSLFVWYIRHHKVI
jgi:hypothetical protein